MNRQKRARMPKRGNQPMQESGFGTAKDIRDKPSLKLDRANEGGTPTSPAPIVDVYNKRRARRGGGGLWRRKAARMSKGDRRATIGGVVGGGLGMYRRKRQRRRGRNVNGLTGFAQGAQYNQAPLAITTAIGQQS